MTLDEHSGPDYTVPPWLTPPPPTAEPPVARPHADRPLAEPVPVRRVPAMPAPVPLVGPAPAQAAGLSLELSGDERVMIRDIQDRVATRLAAADIEFPAAALRPRTRALIREEFEQLLSYRATAGNPPIPEDRETLILAAALAEIEGLGRLAPLLARADIEDIHIQSTEATQLRLTNGDLVEGPPVGETDEQIVALFHKLGARQFDGQSSRAFDRANATLSLRIPGPTALGARLEASHNSVTHQTSATIRVHHHSDVTLAGAIGLGMIDRPIYHLLRAAARGGPTCCSSVLSARAKPPCCAPT